MSNAITTVDSVAGGWEVYETNNKKWWYTANGTNTCVIAGGTFVEYSTNGGKTWTTSPNSNLQYANINGLAYDGSTYLVASSSSQSGSSYTLYSINGGDSWIQGQQTSGASNGVATGNGKFISSTSDRFYIADTVGGTVPPTDWNVSFAHSNTGNGMTGAYGNSTFVLVWVNGNIMYSTDNAASWTELPASTSGISSGVYDITFGDGKFCLFDPKHSYTSTDGITWTKSDNEYSANWQGITYGKGKFVAVSHGHSNSDLIASSSDGLNWTMSKAPAETDSSIAFRSISYLSGTFDGVAGRFLAFSDNRTPGQVWMSETGVDGYTKLTLVDDKVETGIVVTDDGEWDSTFNSTSVYSYAAGMKTVNINNANVPIENDNRSTRGTTPIGTVGTTTGKKSVSFKDCAYSQMYFGIGFMTEDGTKAIQYPGDSNSALPGHSAGFLPQPRTSLIDSYAWSQGDVVSGQFQIGYTFAETSVYKVEYDFDTKKVNLYIEGALATTLDWDPPTGQAIYPMTGTNDGGTASVTIVQGSSQEEVDVDTTIDLAFTAGTKVVGKGTPDYTDIIGKQTAAFRTKLYTGNGYPNGNSQTITSNVNTTGSSLVWLKSTSAGGSNWLFSPELTLPNLGEGVRTDSTEGSAGYNYFSEFLTDGFTLSSNGSVNSNTVEYTSWSFRCAPGFFDIVTYNGNRATPKTIPHNLQSKPGCILIKSTDNSGYSWCVYHQELDIDEYMFLNTTSQAQSGDAWNNTEPTSSNFSIGSIGNVNNGTSPYIAYLFADTDEKIKCGAYDGTGTSNNVVNVGFKPEWVMIKCVGDVSGNWMLMDRQRGTSGVTANSSDRDINYGGIFEWTDTGFTLGSTNNNFNADTQKYIYVAIAENLDAGQKLPSKAAFTTTTL